MNKYTQTLVKNVRAQLEIWQNMQACIPHSELYRFLHSIVGTAATIGFDKAGETARALMDQLEEVTKSQWTKDELQAFLLPLISVFYYKEVASNVQNTVSIQQAEDRSLVLLIDDDTALLMYLKDELEKHGLVVIAIADPERAIHSYYDLNPDCVILDIHMKDENGLNVLSKLKENLKQHFVPTIMISVDNTKEKRLKSYKLGADDFIPKPIDVEEFIVRINRQLERKKAFDDLILVDELTNVYNRKYLQRTYDRLVSNLKRRNETFSLALLDLDKFKQINDTYGHIIGDKVLATFAEILRNGLRLNDTIIRYGGDEFIILLPETKAKEAKLVLDRALFTFSQTPFEDADGSNRFYCNFSAGVHQIFPNELDLKRNIEIADGALYEAKSEGRNLVKVVPIEDGYYHKKRIHIGVIDDDPIIRAMLHDLISKSKLTDGFTLDIQSFKDGMEFFESDWHEQQDEPYLIILDGVMPRMDGIEVLQKLRSLRFQERFTIIMLTSRKSEQDIARALQLGADDYITKPFKLLELETRLSHLMKRMK